jgi:hypothetical protein
MASRVRRLPFTLRGLATIITGLLAVQGGLAAPQGRMTAGDERIAANVAEKFAWALSFSVPVAYELLDDGARARMQPADFVTAFSAAFPDGPPARLEATHVATARPGILDVFLTGESLANRGYIRVGMTGAAARAYRVRDFLRVPNGVDASARVLPRDNGPFTWYYPVARDSQIAFVPISADVAVVSALADSFATRLRLATKLQAVFTPSAAAHDSERRQLIAEVLARELQPRCQRGMSGTPFVIGVTGEDMYLRSYPRWRFAFSYRLAPCVAVVSYARMQIDGSPELRAARLRKMTAKNLGVLVYGLSASSDPRSMMFNDILGLEDLDFMDENFNRAGMAPENRK